MHPTPPIFLKRIEEAKKKKSKKLNLSKSLNWHFHLRKIHQLREIPREVFELHWLEEIDLSNNLLTGVPEEIRDLKRLRLIDLRGNPLHSIPDVFGLYLELEKLKEFPRQIQANNIRGLKLMRAPDRNLSDFENLRFLDVRNSRIRDYSFLRNLSDLEILDLSSNKLSDISILSELKGLTNLYLSDNELSDISILSELKGLTNLYLSDNELSDITILSELKGLTSLDLSNNQLSDITILSELKGLTYLYLNENLLSDITILSELKGLTYLYLNENYLSDISILSELKGLTNLDLSNNELSDITTLSELKRLTYLYLNENYLSDITSLSGLKGLTSLDLSNNELSDISNLSELKGLTYLDLGFNQLSDISSLSELKGLRHLNLSSNQLSDISSLSELKGLMDLALESNQLSDISSLSELKGLTFINVENNEIRRLPPEILTMNLQIKWETGYINGLILRGNPIESPPVEIIKKGNNAIRAYFESLEGGKKPLNEAKIILVGDGEAGKTSVVKRLLGEPFDPNEPTTHGIRIRDWEIEGDIGVHFWDFGGQQIMHATHQFFLSKRSLYILVLDGRREENAEYWLKHIQSFGGDSPVLVVMNKMDQHPSFDVNRHQLLGKYTNIMGFYRVSCLDGEGVADLLSYIRTILPNMESVQSAFAKSWFSVKDRLSAMKDDYINYDAYQSICEQAGVLDKNARDALLDFLHDLGIIVHFRDFQLTDTNVLNPRWLTEAVYKIINSPLLAESNGVLRLDLVTRIMEKKSAEDHYYPDEKLPYIINIMEKFELCYPLGNARILVPDLLEIGEPKFEFDYERALTFLFQYDFLPRSIMPRFIVQSHRDIKSNLRWRTGVVLEDPAYKAIAAVKADNEERRIQIWVAGEQKRDYFSVIRKTIRNINDSFEKLGCKELIPLPDHPEHTVEYSELVGLERMGETNKVIGKLEKKYSVSKLLDGVERPDERKRLFREILKERELNLKIDASSKINAQGAFHQSFTAAQKAEQTQHVEQKTQTDVGIEIKSLKGDFRIFKEDLIDELDLEIEDEKERARVKNELKRVENAIDEIEAAAADGTEADEGAKKRFAGFIEGLETAESRVGKALDLLEKGKEHAKKFGKIYNNIAPFCGLPSIPSFLVEKTEK